MLKAVIFDFDGVLADTYDINLKIYREFYPDVTEEEFEGLFKNNPLVNHREWTDKHRYIFAQKQAQLFTKELLRLHDLVQWLSSRYLLFIVSSSEDENIKSYLGLGGLNKYFNQILGATTHRSKVEKFKLIFSKYNLKPEECLFITDTTGDIKEAKAVGLPTMAVTWGYHKRELLETAGADWVVDTPEELKSIIEKYSNNEQF